MPRFLTRKACPYLIVKLLEFGLLIVLGVWLAAGMRVAVNKFSAGFTWPDVFAFCVVCLPSMLVVGWMISRWRLRRLARKVAQSLEWEIESAVRWAQLDVHAGVQDAQALVTKLCAKGYLTGISPDADELTIHPDAAGPSAAVIVRRCSVCGAVLERRVRGSWVCRYCGKTAQKNA